MPLVVQIYEAQVYDEFVIAGNTAVMKCQIPSFVADYVSVTSWLRDSSFNIYASYDDVDGKYLILPSGELQIRDVRNTDGFSTYRCRTVHQLTKDTRLSATAGKLFVTEPRGTVPPRITDSKVTLMVKEGSMAVLPCTAQAYPVPTYSWLVKTDDGRTISVAEKSGRMVRAGGNLLIRNVQLKDAGVYICLVQNPVGTERVEVLLGVTAPLTAYMDSPKLQVDINQAATFRCIISGHPKLSITWLKDGKPLTDGQLSISISNDVLHINSVTKKNRGMYQCLVSNDVDSVQAAAELRLGDIPPTIAHISSEETTYPGRRVSLKCVASGSPLPVISWTLDDRSVGETDKYRPSVYTNEESNAVGHLNITEVSLEDGGTYACVATNKVGVVISSTRINVFGRPFIRPMGKKSVVAGTTLIVHCPYAGYPIDSLLWEKGETRLPVSHLQVVFPNGTLKVLSVQRGDDAGIYTCIARNKQGQSARREMEVMVLVPPKINPTSFQDTRLHEGAHARIICAVVEGDLPITFAWLKDGRAVAAAATELGLAIRDFDEFSSVLTVSKAAPSHSGNYTCVARNAVASDHYTAQITVNVPPQIIPFSFQGDFLFEGTLARVACVVSQGDLPLVITWSKDGGHLAPDLGVTVRDFDEHSSVLTINRVTSRHNGNYTCSAQNPAGSVNFTAQLVVQVPPRWMVQPSDVTMLPGSLVVIDCQASGFPVPRIEWLKAVENTPGEYEALHSSDPSIHKLENGSLVLGGARVEHEGRYLCRATNGVGNGLSKMITVDVRVPVRFDVHFRNETVQKGQDAKLHCMVRGDLPIRITWLRNQEKLSSIQDVRYKLSESATEEGLVSQLSISRSHRRDTALFTCLAENEFGNDESRIQLVIIEPPDAPKDLVVVDQSARSLKLSWTRPFEGNNQITHFIVTIKAATDPWTKTHNFSAPAKDTTVVISDLKPATNYHCRVLAVNEAGSSEPSESINFSTLEEAPSGTPLSVRAEATGADVVKVTWKPPKKELWNGNILGYYIGYKLHDSSEPYSFLTVETAAKDDKELTVRLEDLRHFTKYGVVVQAYNHMGTSPRSDEIIVLTSEDVPSLPPENIRCSALSSQSFQVMWEPPPSSAVNGVLQGYKVVYRPEDEWYDDSEVETKVTPGLGTVISGLHRFTNYSVQVMAFTRMGDGVRSDPVVCQTHEDVPEAPENIKAVVTSQDSILIAWKPPIRPNGSVKKYTVYTRSLENGKEPRDIEKYSVSASELEFEVKTLNKKDRYEFWVTASTSLGEGQSTSVVSAATRGPPVAARIISFGGPVISPWRTNLELQCKAAGIPQPDLEWKIQGQPLEVASNRVMIKDSVLKIAEVQTNDSGNYSCHAKNSAVPPDAPILLVSATTYTSIEVKWEKSKDGKIPVQGYYLYYKREFGEWEEIYLGADNNLYLLNHLECGNRYQIYIAAVNKLGIGRPSEMISTKTKGSAPAVPSKPSFIREDQRFVTLQLESWSSGGCPILYFVVEYKPRGARHWNLVSNNVVLKQREFVIPDLELGMWFNLRVMAHNSAGSTMAEYEFATKTVTGGTVAPIASVDRSVAKVSFFYDIRVILPLTACLLVLFVVGSLLSICCRRKLQMQRHQHSGQGNMRQEESRPPNKAEYEKNSSMGSFTYLLGNNTKGPIKNMTPLFVAKDNISPYATSQISSCQNKDMLTFSQQRTSPQQDMREGTYPRTKKQVTQQLQQCPRPESLYNTDYTMPLSGGEILDLGTSSINQYSSQPWLIRPPQPITYDQHVPDLLDHGPESSSSNEISPDSHLRQEKRRQSSGNRNQLRGSLYPGIRCDPTTEETTFIFNHSDDPKDAGYEEEDLSDTEFDNKMAYNADVARYNDQNAALRVNSSPLIHRLVNGYDL
uniref:Down syndrome cell adhesion molecule-like protein Dscam2 n=1 Tax=Strigamia maritima TaxID=126957 RepID=T1IRM3_STRMM